MTVVGVSILFFSEKILPDLSVFFRLLISTIVPVIISLLTSAYFFFRDPERTPPRKNNVILSPADGKVIYINEINNGDFPIALKGKNKIPLSEFTGEDFISGKGIQIGIAMSFIHVHVNRSPIEGKISKIRKVPGEFKSLKHINSLLENERVFTQINSKNLRIGIVQIASRLVRRIESYKKENDNVEIGERIGIIKFGSQVDLLIDNPDVRVKIEIGDELKAGFSILADY
jgi:phosphatidylserine decarboxylase